MTVIPVLPGQVLETDEDGKKLPAVNYTASTFKGQCVTASDGDHLWKRLLELFTVILMNWTGCSQQNARRAITK